MTAVYYFSGTGHSKAVAEYIAEELGCTVISIETAGETAATHTAVVVFPVYSDNIPSPVRRFLPELRSVNVALIAVYGRMSFGNVITQAARLCAGRIICGAYIPSGHTYLDQPPGFDRESLAPVVERLRSPESAELPRERASLLGGIFPEIRARMAVKIKRNDRCTDCGLCTAKCPVQSMNNGITGRGCLRCLRCVKECPRQALDVKYLPILKSYLSRERKNDTVIYL